MAIYDNDGTANYEIGKLYDNDGTANHQIGKVYDFDGTVNSLIYTGTPEYLYKDGDQCTSDTGGWQVATGGIYWYWGNIAEDNNDIWDESHTSRSATFADSYVELTTAGSYTGTVIKTNNLIDCSGISRLTFSFNVTQYPGAYTTAYQSVHCSVVDDGATPVYEKSAGWAMNASGNQTLTLDVSGLNGSYYIYFGLASGNGYSSTIHLTSVAVTASS